MFPELQIESKKIVTRLFQKYLIVICLLQAIPGAGLAQTV
jgi:hypothetical protein